METAREVVEQIFGEWGALLGPNDHLIFTILDGHLDANLIDKLNVKDAAIGLDRVIDVLAARIG